MFLMSRATVQIPDDEVIQPACSIFRRYLKRAGAKFTPERAKILDAVMVKERVFEADELFLEMRENGLRVSKATIYRTLKHLLDARIISEVLIDTKQSHYQLNLGSHARAHLVCDKSNRMVELDIPELKDICDRVCEEHGFDPLNYHFVIYGVCGDADEDETC